MYNHVGLKIFPIVGDKNRFIEMRYQDAILEKVFAPGQRVSNITDHLGITKFRYGITAYVLLLQYCYEINEHLLKNMSRPDLDYGAVPTRVDLIDNSIEQFDMIASKAQEKGYRGRRGNVDSLFSVINKTQTPMGKRHLMRLLCNPMTSIPEITAYYDRTSFFLEEGGQGRMRGNSTTTAKKYYPSNHHSHYPHKKNKYPYQEPALLTSVGNSLSTIDDLEKLHRKLYLEEMKPAEVGKMCRSHRAAAALFTSLYHTSKKAKNPKYHRTAGPVRENAGSLSKRSNLLLVNGRHGDPRGSHINERGATINFGEEFSSQDGSAVGWQIKTFRF